MSKIDTDEMEKICAAATPGPWGFYGKFDGLEEKYVTCGIRNEKETVMNAPMGRLNANRGDVRFIAAARTGWPETIKRVRELELENERIRHNRLLWEKAFTMYAEDSGDTPDGRIVYYLKLAAEKEADGGETI